MGQKFLIEKIENGFLFEDRDGRISFCKDRNAVVDKVEEALGILKKPELNTGLNIEAPCGTKHSSNPYFWLLGKILQMSGDNMSTFKHSELGCLLSITTGQNNHFEFEAETLEQTSIKALKTLACKGLCQ